ncbi:MAG: ribbon-helix-helix protein, CopG family [Hydrogenophaga sp.]|uniref:ribbon-helix-helix domain-containing protein n=1 Tax=Hydrogenophaga sp. TaxID=1904254 RepID=UPI00275F9663|nr:ribbon-helix-helix protein, CopG family [Hydrogenophaga sp.]MDP2417892.1 ribbon-helix-helix protein, CopG family [Hydrogenophaga sp.]MDZ4190243.1 ribbon-helix-helix protein, CopG family [Hydrogenophaga sp.]
MNTLTIKIQPELDESIARLSAQEHLSKSELVRRAITAYIQQKSGSAPAVSALERAGHLVGCFDGGPTDLSSNSRHLDGFGQV